MLDGDLKVISSTNARPPELICPAAMPMPKIKSKPAIPIKALVNQTQKSVLKDGFHYISHGENGGRCVTRSHDNISERMTLPLEDTQSAAETTRYKGGDCDDMAVLYVYRLQQQNKSQYLEFGVVNGYLKLINGTWGAHGVVAVRDKRHPLTYDLYEASWPQSGFRFHGTYQALPSSFRPFPAPAGNDVFVLNEFIPVTPDGHLDTSPDKRVYFVPPRSFR